MCKPQAVLGSWDDVREKPSEELYLKGDPSLPVWACIMQLENRIMVNKI